MATPLCVARSQEQSPSDTTPRGAIARDSTGQRVAHLRPTIVTATRHAGVSRLDGDSAGRVYTGATTARLTLESLQANLANDNDREVLGRVPGANISETRGGGFPSNGIGVRGLNPT